MPDDPRWHQVWIQNKFGAVGWQWVGWLWAKPSVAFTIASMWADPGTTLIVQTA